MPLNELNIEKYSKFMSCFPKKDKIEFINLEKIKFENIRQVKILLQALDSNFNNMFYLTI